jgi:hypothetical protein
LAFISHIFHQINAPRDGVNTPFSGDCRHEAGQESENFGEDLLLGTEARLHGRFLRLYPKQLRSPIKTGTAQDFFHPWTKTGYPRR